MDRKDFFKKIGLTSVAIAFSPQLLANCVSNAKEGGTIDIHKWYKKNRHWLMKWLDNYEVVKIPLEEIKYTMQRFITVVYKSQMPMLHEFYNEHKDMILIAAVFSKPTHHTFPTEGVLSTMDGFLNQTGRLPTKDDKVIFEVCPPDAKGKRFLRVSEIRDYDGYPCHQLLSDCRIKIL